MPPQRRWNFFFSNIKTTNSNHRQLHHFLPTELPISGVCVEIDFNPSSKNRHHEGPFIEDAHDAVTTCEAGTSL